MKFESRKLEAAGEKIEWKRKEESRRRVVPKDFD